jgi:ribosome modulation factor
MANKYNKIKAATTRGYNDCVKGITTCPYKLDEELQIAWLQGFNDAYDTRRSEHEAAWQQRHTTEQPAAVEPSTEQPTEAELNEYYASCATDNYPDFPADGYFVDDEGRADAERHDLSKGYPFNF